VWTIVRFNWPFYLAALVVLVAAAVLLESGVEFPFFLIGGTAFAGSLWFLAGSLGASHWVYDRSDLYRWGWLRRRPDLPAEADVLVCHTGFDEVSESLENSFPGWRVKVIDHYDGAIMTEASIRRARQAHPPKPTDLTAPFDRWPELHADLILAILSIHELRSESARGAWFAEARRTLRPRGKVIVVEHARDPANFAAFGPGFLHFHSVRSWHRCWSRAGFRLSDHFRITPFVRVFILQ
jgi:hypothetical protein